MVPLVLVPGRRRPPTAAGRSDTVTLGQPYLLALRRAGAEGVVALPDAGAIGLAPQLVARVDGVLLAGGGDVDPARYGAAGCHAEVAGVDPHHDAFEIATAQAALAAGVPLLAICRGMQVLNVALGGTLVQHLDAGDHRLAVHPVELVEGCRAAVAMGTTRPSGWSRHHQALDRVADALVVTGRAPDGTVEAVEGSGRWVVGVQWHPEDSTDDPAQQGLFDAFVAACRERAAAHPAWPGEGSPD